MRVRVTHGIAGSTGHSSWRSDSEQWRKNRQLRPTEYREFSSSDAQLELWVFQYPIAALLSIEHIWMMALLAESFLVSVCLVLWAHLPSTCE